MAFGTKMPKCLLTNNYNVQNRVGKGAFGTVYKAVGKDDGKVVAIKVGGKIHRTLPNIKCRESYFLESLSHHNIVTSVGQFYVHTQSPSTSGGYTSAIVMEYCPWSLLKFVKEVFVTLNVEDKLDLSRQLVEGLAYIHSKKVMHRDIKPENILVTQKGVIKIADFGLASHLDEDYTSQTYVMTRWYRPPELLLGKSYTEAVDVWSAGCVIAEIFSQNALFRGSDNRDQLTLILTSCVPLCSYRYNKYAHAGCTCSCWCPMSLQEIKWLFKDHYLPQCQRISKENLSRLSKCSDGRLMAILQSCLVVDPASRLSAQALLDHPVLVKGDNSLTYICGLLSCWELNRS